MPAETLGKGFEVPMCFRMDCALAPLGEVVPMAFFFADDVEVLLLTVHCVSNEKCFWIQPYRAQLSLPQRNGVAEEYGSDDATTTQRAALMAHITN